MTRFLFVAAAAFAVALTPTLGAHAHQDEQQTQDIVSTHGADTIAVGDLHLFNIFTRQSPPNARNAGGFLSIYNYASDGDRLVSASSPIAQRVELHTMTMDNDVMRMRMLPDGIELPGQAQVDLAPGGLHVMFIGLEGPFEVGAEIPVTLVFENSGSREVMMPVRARGEVMDHSSDHGSHQ